MDHQHRDRSDGSNGAVDSGAKRLKVAPDDDDGADERSSTSRSSSLLDPLLNPNLRAADGAGLAALRARYEAASPYPHLLIDDFLDRDFLDKTVEEIKDHSSVDFKESDLFKFYQSMDLASLGCGSGNNESSNENGIGNGTARHVHRLRQILYSPEWRHTVETVLGLGPGTLSNRVDCACNCHAASCHLLCHDDVIRTRKVSYILYLVDDDWSPPDGGALELYGPSTPNSGDPPGTTAVVVMPDTVPSVRLTPKYNTLCLFEVKPGVSFHSVQEVTRTTSPRLSLQGWYHARTAPDHADQATLCQLKAMRDGSHRRSGEEDDDSFEAYVEDPSITASGVDNVHHGVAALSERDVEYLARYLDPSYLQEPALREMRERFEETSSLQLRSLFLPGHVGPLNAALANDDRLVAVPIHHENLYALGADSDWTLQGPPHMQRYLRYSDSGSPSSEAVPPTSGTMLSDIQRVMRSKSFAKFLERVTGLVPTGCRGEIRRFRPGRDYTVAHYGLLRPKGVLDGTLVFCAGNGEPVCEQTPDASPDVLWQSGDVGGFECYIEADDDDGGGGEDELYKGAVGNRAQPPNEGDGDEDDNDGTELLSVSAANNTLSLVYRDPGTMRFVKYVSIQAPSSRWDIALEYRVAEDDNDEEEEEDKETPYKV